MIKHLRRLGVVYTEDINAAMVASTDNNGPVFAKLHHLHVESFVWNFERSCWGGSIDGIQFVSGSQVIDDDVLLLWADVQISA